MSDAVLFDGWCGEPIAWARVGEPVIGHEWTQHGRLAVTGWLSASEAVRKYGPITEVVLGRNGGFRSVTYGDKKFVAKCVDPRGSGLYDDSVVVVDDPARDNYECPVCGAMPGEQCINKKKQPCSTHSKRSQGRSRWDIERAEVAAARQREEAREAEQWKRKMATPPAIGDVLEVENQKLDENYQWVPDAPDRYTVQQTYSNRVIKVLADNGEHVFLARNEYNGIWLRVCGLPTVTRLPCRNNRCQTRHKAGLQLREDQPW
ncbi:MAG: hypothetical protein J2P17_15045 [Mycobacterium sp.]|nr:hypothetical protein [Mycobacterium sp.]